MTRARLLAAVVLPLLCLTIGAAPLRSQQSTQPQQDQRPPVFRGAANFVYVDAYPRRDGKLVENLRADDFQIFEDGKLQTVQTFDFIRIEPNAPDTERRDPETKEEGDQLAADPHNRVFVVYLDMYHTTFVGAHDARSPLLQFLNRTIGPTDLFGVLTPEVPARQLVFARRTDTLEAELTKYYDWGLEGQPVFPRTPEEEQLFTSCGDDGLIVLHREDLMATSLEELMVHLRDLRDERKNVLLISEGWVPRQARLVAGRGSIPLVGPGPGGRLGIGVPKQGSLYNASFCDAQIARLSNIDFEQRFKDLLSLANRANVSFYPVDVGGLKGDPGFSADVRTPPAPQALLAMHNQARGRLDTLRELAENTDGRAIVDTNDLAGAFRQIGDDLSAYYLLGYASTNGGLDGKFHRIEVKMKPAGIKVTARRGYLAPVLDAKPSALAAPPSRLDDEFGRLARLRSDAELFTNGVRTAGGLDVIAEIASSQIELGRWHDGADVDVRVTGAGGREVTAKGRIEPGTRGVVVAVPLTDAGSGPWQASVRVTHGEDRADDRLDIRDVAGAIVGAPEVFRGTASARVALRPVADFQFGRSERLHIEWAARRSLDQRTARLLDRRGQPMAVPVTVTERDASGAPVVAADLNLSPLGEGDYAIELVAGSGADTERALVAFRVVR